MESKYNLPTVSKLLEGKVRGSYGNITATGPDRADGNGVVGTRLSIARQSGVRIAVERGGPAKRGSGSSLALHPHAKLEQRNKLVEQSIAKHESFSPFLEHQRLGKDDILCVREKHLNELLDLLEKQLLQHGASSRRRSSFEDGQRAGQEPSEVYKGS